MNHTDAAQLYSLGQHLPEAGELMGASIIFRRNAEIYGEGEPADYLYKMLSGTAMTYKILSDGRRQVGGFHLPGDIFGLEAGDAHSLSAEAVSRCNVLVVKRSALVAMAGRQQEIALEVLQVMGHELRRVQTHTLLLIRSAQERVAAFLLEMAERNSTGDVIEVPMSRQDIADYLGLTVETVSRTLTQLEILGAIELSSRRRIALRNRSMLHRLNC
ncbi:MAG TPA: helix-turn-helix domain-containing protein [Xanthobacteraceae bacterium]|jgi:CRP-like cAMP-binding protein|nr:helix-turn-helix domain-containing protein [Xanthobacteraceae bacterium]